MKDNKHKIFEHGECISEDVLLAYVNNTLNTKEKHIVEKHALGCEMCADALEGIAMMKNPSQLKGIVESLNKKIAGGGAERKPIVLWMDTRVRVAVAAGLALLIGLFFMFNNSLNETGDNKTVSDNLKQKDETAADSTSMSLEENAKTDSGTDLKFHQSTVTDKDKDLKADEKRLEKSGDVSNRNANAGPGLGTKDVRDGDALKSKDYWGKFKKTEAPAPPPNDAEQQTKGFNDITLDRSKSADDNKSVLQDEKKPDDGKKKEGKDDQSVVTGKVTTVSPVTNNESVNSSTNESYKHYTDIKTDGPKKEEKEKVVKQDLSRKDKKKSTGNDDLQKKPLEKNNSGGKEENLANTKAPQSTTVVTGGTNGNAAPNMVPQNNATDQEITLSKNKQQSEEDTYSRNDSMKVNVPLDSISKYGYYGMGEVSGEKKYTDKDYDGAIIVFAKTLETKPTDREALYKLGDSYLHVNKPDQAIVQFDKLITMGKGAYYDAARYDKSQALLKQKKNAEAKKLLMEIEQTSTEYKSRAKVELDKIK